MANDVVLGSAMRQNLLSLQNTQKSIDVTQLRLATGKKVNSALDNPQSFFQAQGLNNRASDLTRLLDGIGQSIRTIEEADKGVTAMTSLINQATSVAESAESEMRAAQGLVTITGTTDLRGVNLTTQSNGSIATAEDFQITVLDADITTADGVATNGRATNTIAIAANDTVYNLVAKINSSTEVSKFARASVDSQGHLKIESLEDGASIRISDSTTAANSLDSDGFAFLGLQDLVTLEDNLAVPTRLGGTAVSGRTLTSAAAAVGSKVNNEFVASAVLGTGGAGAGYLANFATGGADDAVLTLRVDNTSYTIGQYNGADSTIQSVIDGINSSGAGEFVSASFNTDTGKIELAFGDNVGTAEITWTGEVAGTTSFGFGSGASDAVLGANSLGEAFRFVGSSANLDQYTKDFNKLRGQIDGIVEDANYRGVNLLGGDKLTTFFNEDRSNKLETEGVDLTTLGLGIDKADFKDAASIEESLNQVRNALGTVRAFGSSIANDLSIIQTREDFTNQTISTLKSGASDLTDADLNEEGANLLALQTAQQLGVTSLSLASQSQQSVLRLF